MADTKDPLSAHNLQYDFQDGEDGISVGQATKSEKSSISSNQEDAEHEVGDIDSLHPMRKELMQSGLPEILTGNTGMRETVIEFKRNNTVDEEKTENVEVKPADLLESAPLAAMLEESQTLQHACEVYEEALIHHSIEHVQEESQQPIEILNQQNGTQEAMDLSDNEQECKEEDEREKIMPKEIRQKVSSVIPALLKVVEDDKCCCCCNCDHDCTTSCLSTCCLPCNNPFRKSWDTHVAAEEEFHIFNETLRKGSEAGRAIFQEIIFPLIRPFTRDLIAISEFLVGLIGLILSIVSFSLGSNAVYNILHFALAILSILLGFTDMIVSLKFSAAFAKVIKKLRNCSLGQPGNDTEANQNQKDEYPKEPSFLKKGWDTGRILVSEAILYPLLICDLIKFIVGKGYEVNEPIDMVTLVLFILSSASLIFYVYIVRLGVLIAMVFHLQKSRTLDPKQKEALAEWSAKNGITTDENVDSTAATKARHFQIYFIYHVMGQMASQVMMIVAVSLKIADDNKDRTLESPLHISNALWFMLVAGYVMPFLGILSFFIPTLYWVYEYENGLCLDFLSLLNMPGIDHVLFPDGEEMKEAYESIQKIASKLNNRNKLREYFEELRSVGFCTKVSYAFRNPFLVAACLAYSIAQLIFVIVAIGGIQSTLGTVIYYFISIFIGILANVYVFLVAAFWAAVIFSILVVVSSIVPLLIGICIALIAGLSCASQRNSDRNENR